jgi:cation transport ATPase
VKERVVHKVKSKILEEEAFPGFITLWLAVAIGDMGLSLAVILNALRIGKKSI